MKSPKQAASIFIASLAVVSGAFSDDLLLDGGRQKYARQL